MVENDVLKHVLWNACIVKSLCHAFPDKGCLAGVFQHNNVARDQCGSDSVNGCHVRIVPRGYDQNHSMWHSLDDAAEVVAVLDLDIGERVLRDTRHVAGAFVKTAELATVADRAAHLVGKFRHDLIVHFAHIGDPGLHKGNAVVQRRAAQSACAALARATAA